MKIYVCTAEDYDVHQICGAFYNEEQAKKWAERQTSEDLIRKQSYRDWLADKDKAKQAKFGCTYPSIHVTYKQLRDFDKAYEHQSPPPFSGTGYGYGYEEVEVE